jgi:hypothetical protein
MRLGKTNSLNNISSQEVLVTSTTLTGFTGNLVVAYSNSDPKEVNFIQEMPVGTVLNIVPKVQSNAVVGPIVTFASGTNIVLNSSVALDTVTDTLCVWYDGVSWNQITAIGTQGSSGTPGVQGANGAQGAQGDNGPQGAQGNPGDQGPQGDNGVIGASGAQGAQGDNGT